MKIFAQNTTQAQMTADSQVTGKIGQGFLLLVGITHTDTQADADLPAKKIAYLCVFFRYPIQKEATITGSLFVIKNVSLYYST